MRHFGNFLIAFNISPALQSPLKIHDPDMNEDSEDITSECKVEQSDKKEHKIEHCNFNI